MTEQQQKLNRTRTIDSETNRTKENINKVRIWKLIWSPESLSAPSMFLFFSKSLISEQNYFEQNKFNVFTFLKIQFCPILLHPITNLMLCVCVCMCLCMCVCHSQRVPSTASARRRSPSLSSSSVCVGPSFSSSPGSDTWLLVQGPSVQSENLYYQQVGVNNLPLHWDDEVKDTHQLSGELRDGLVSTPQLLSELLHLLQKSLDLHTDAHTHTGWSGFGLCKGSAVQAKPHGGTYLCVAAVGWVSGIRTQSICGQSVLVHVLLLNIHTSHQHTTLKPTHFSR